MSLSRRAWLGGAAAGLSLPAAARAQTELTPLKTIAASRGLRFGNAIGKASFADPRARALTIAQCALVVPENELKWQALRPDIDTFAFERADRIVGWAGENGLAVRGHNLFWTPAKWFPAWVNAYNFSSAGEAEKLITDHVTRVVTRYKDRIRSWDVVNEAIEPKTGLMRQNAFTPKLGERCLDIAFHAARAADPTAQLVYNDYMSWEVGNETHRGGVLKLLERLKSRGAPVDALGLQSHLGPGDQDQVNALDRAQPREWKTFLDGATGTGLGLLVTEFDVNDRGLAGDITVRDRRVADYAKAYFDLTLSYPQLTDVLCWGLDDRYSWLQGWTPRADHLPQRPCPYDAEFKPKPLRQALAAAFAGAPAR
jgi:endo-1,4-beta-xylanase